MASNKETTSSISGLLSGLASQHRLITFARELGQHLGISGLRFYALNSNHYPAKQLYKTYFRIRNEVLIVNFFFVVVNWIRKLYLANHGRSYFGKTKVWIRHIAAVYLPQTDSVTIHVTFPIIRVAIENL